MGNDPVNNVDPDGGMTGAGIAGPHAVNITLTNPATPIVGQFSGTAQSTSVSAGASGTSGTASSSGGSSGSGGFLNGLGNAAAGALGMYVANKLLPMPQGPDAAQLQQPFKQNPLIHQVGNKDDDESGWKPLYKKDLDEFITYVTGQKPTENEMGEMFENIVEKYVEEHINTGLPGHPFDVFKDGFRRTRPNEVSDYGNRNTKPDFKADLYTDIWYDDWNHYRYHEQGAVWYEAKQKGGGLYLSTDTYQIKGHIDNMNSEWGALARRWKRYSFRPVLMVMTTADVNEINSIRAYGWQNNVEVRHLRAYYKLTNEGIKFWFKY